jgi:hypothetical protein
MVRFQVLNVPRPRRALGQFTAIVDNYGQGIDQQLSPTTSIAPYPGAGTTQISPWDLKSQLPRVQPQTSSEESADDIWAMKKKAPAPAPPPPPPPPMSDFLVQPPDQQSPTPRFISQQDADAAKNLSGLAIAGGLLVAGVGAALLLG